MDNFKVIYKILKALEKALDYEEFDYSEISNERLKISYERWEQLLIMIYQNDYISNLVVTRDLATGRYHLTEPISPTITLKGLEYLSENTMMKKVASSVKGVVEVVDALKPI